MKKETLLAQANELRRTLVDTRRTLHRMPGTGFDTQETLAFVRQELEQLGLSVRSCGRAGLVALVGGKRSGRVFLLRADMDGLPIEEASGEPFAAQNGKMHACGHDLHTAMLLGCARLLKAHEDEICGTVKLMFQSAEEIFEGAEDMLASGVLENPKVDAALMIHVMAGMPLPSGTVIVSAPGVSAPGADFFEIRVQGRGCHGSAPSTGIDPLTAAAHILIALQEIQARELAMNDRAALTVGTLRGGSAANVIPDSAVLGGSIRTYDEEVRSQIKKRLTEIAQGVAGAFRAQAHVTFGSGCPCLVNDQDLSRCCGAYAKELLGERGAFTVEELQAMGGGAAKAAGSEDFAYVSQAVPSVMLALAAGQPERGYAYPQHHPQVRFDEDALPVGSCVYAYMALRWLEDHGGEA